MPAASLNFNFMIDTRPDRELKDTVIGSGTSAYTSPFSLRRDGITGSFAIYIECSGAGSLTLSYEVDPGDEALLDRNKHPYNWFVPDYRNPFASEIPAGKIVVPFMPVVGQYIRFKLEATGGDVQVDNIRLVIQ